MLHLDLQQIKSTFRNLPAVIRNCTEREVVMQKVVLAITAFHSSLQYLPSSQILALQETNHTPFMLRFNVLKSLQIILHIHIFKLQREAEHIFFGG